MDMNNAFKDNKGFSLVELIAITAIMVVMVGAGSLAVSLLIGSEAKQACEKIGAQLNEVKTGSMARYSEDLNIVYVADPGSYDWAEKEGYYAVKQMTTLTKRADDMPDHTSMGQEHRYLCNSRVHFEFVYDNGGDVTYNIPSDGDGICFTFNRSNGLFSDVKTDCSIQSDGSVIGTSIANSVPKKLLVTSGVRTYTIDFIADTGKHTITN